MQAAWGRAVGTARSPSPSPPAGTWAGAPHPAQDQGPTRLLGIYNKNNLVRYCAVSSRVDCGVNLGII